MTEKETALFTEHMNLVPWVIIRKLKIASTNELFNDLMQEGYIALMYACENYDEQKGKFLTYAISRIRITCSNYRISEQTLLSRRDYETLTAYLKQNPQTTKDVDEFTKANSIRPYRLAQIIGAYNKVELDNKSAITTARDVDLHDIIADPNSPYTDTRATAELSIPELEQCWIEAGECLCETYRNIWLDYCYGKKREFESGADGALKIKQEVLAAKYGISQSSVSKAIKQGRAALKELIHQITESGDENDN